jgi:hypothetical protein
MTLKIIIDRREHEAQAREYARMRMERAKLAGFDEENLPNISGRGAIRASCDNCGDKLWVESRWDTNFCAECKPAKQRKQKGVGF